MYAPEMGKEDVANMIYYLSAFQSRGYHIVTWNGLGFDFPVVAEASGMWQECAELALGHVDIGFQMLCQLGFMCGLNTAAQAMGDGGKTEGMSGALAPVMWAESADAQKKVLEYVEQDARITADLYKSVVQRRKMYWTTSRGKKSVWYPRLNGDRLLTVKESQKEPLPDIGWMSDPSKWKRENYYRWTQEKE